MSLSQYLATRRGSSSPVVALLGDGNLKGPIPTPNATPLAGKDHCHLVGGWFPNPLWKIPSIFGVKIPKSIWVGSTYSHWSIGVVLSSLISWWKPWLFVGEVDIRWFSWYDGWAQILSIYLCPFQVWTASTLSPSIMVQWKLAILKFNIAPEKWWLKTAFLLGR